MAGCLIHNIGLVIELAMHLLNIGNLIDINSNLASWPRPGVHLTPPADT